jgi:hypothetical protein
MSIYLPHLYYSEEPPKQGSELKGLCGKTVHDVRVAFQVEGDIAGKFSPEERAFCPKCCLAHKTAKVERYLTGIYPARWVKDEAREWL